VGIIGGGMAGVALAWLLDGQYDVVVLEAQPAIGGNVQTVQLEVDGQAYGIDMGAQYFHPKLYRSYIALLTHLGLYPPGLQQAHAFPASISLFADADPFPRFVSPVFWERLWPLFESWNWDGLGAFANGFTAAKTREDQNGDWNLTMEAWLQTLGLPRPQWEGMLLPWAASLFTGNIEQARSFSARAAMIFAATAVPDSPTDPVLSYVLNRGMAEPLRRMVEQLATVEILTRARVERVERVPRAGGFVLRCADGRQRKVDELVLAASGPASLRLLEGMKGTAAHQAALRGIAFDTTRIAVHTDPVYAPKDANHWSFLNCQIHDRYCESSMWLANVLTPAPPQPQARLWKSWVTHRDRRPARTLYEATFRHMTPTVASLQAQARLAALQGRDRIWIAGGYTFPFDSQETALISALRVASGLGVATARAHMFPNA
jgi:predicted NAD/FAD-binding protein